MKKTFKVLGLIFALGAVILTTFHLVLLYGLTRTMREVVLPQVRQKTGFDVSVGRLSIDIPKGMLFLNDVAVKNPEGFLLENVASVERVEVEVNIPSLFKKKSYLVKNVHVGSALVNVVRNKDGEINLNVFQEKVTKPSLSASEPLPEGGKTLPENIPEPGTPAPAETSEVWPEMLIEKLYCTARVRYIDLKLNQLDFALKMKLEGGGLSTLQDSEAAWGKVELLGALGDDKTRFLTDLDLLLAPVTDLQTLSFDLTGKVLEIDPRLMSEIYDRLNVRSDPFGIDLDFHCRFGRFHKSGYGIDLNHIELDHSLSRKLGGMGSIGSLRVVVPVEGTLKKPRVDLESAFKAAVGDNAGSIVEALMNVTSASEAGTQAPISNSEAAVEVLGKYVDKIASSETAKKMLKDLAEGESSATNAPSSVNSDTVIDLLGEEIDEIGENEALKDDLKDLGKWLFGK